MKEKTDRRIRKTKSAKQKPSFEPGLQNLCRKKVLKKLL